VTRLLLLASSDDFLLSESVQGEVGRLSAEMEGATVEVLPEGGSPEDLAVEVRSPSLFSPRRVLVAPDAGMWVETSPAARGRAAPVDVAPLAEALEAGLPEDVALVLGVCCAAKPKGALVDAVARAGEVRWMPLPPRPKPWQDVILSEEEEGVLQGVLERAAGPVRWEPAARRLLLERLGFAPRLLAQEAGKLAVAAGPDGVVDEALVRELTFPREHSLEVVRDAVLKNELAPVLDLLGAAASGLPVRDWQGRALEPNGVATILLGQVSSLFVQMLYLRRLAALTGCAEEMSPRRTGQSYWYGGTFKKRLAGPLIERIAADDGSHFSTKGKGVSPWTLGQLFTGAGRWDEGDLRSALARAGEVESAVRGPLGLEAVTAWLVSALGRPGLQSDRVTP